MSAQVLESDVRATPPTEAMTPRVVADLDCADARRALAWTRRFRRPPPGPTDRHARRPHRPRRARGRRVADLPGRRPGRTAVGRGASRAGPPPSAWWQRSATSTKAVARSEQDQPSRARHIEHRRQNADLLQVQEPGVWDLKSLCRNTTMYVRSEAANPLWEKLEALLRPGGILGAGQGRTANPGQTVDVHWVLPLSPHPRVSMAAITDGGGATGGNEKPGVLPTDGGPAARWPSLSRGP